MLGGFFRNSRTFNFICLKIVAEVVILLYVLSGSDSLKVKILLAGIDKVQVFLSETGVEIQFQGGNNCIGRLRLKHN